MDNASATSRGDIEGVLGRHIWDYRGRVAPRPVSIAKELGCPDGLLCIANGAAHSEAVLQELVDDVQALKAVGSGHQDEAVSWYSGDVEALSRRCRGLDVARWRRKVVARCFRCFIGALAVMQ